MRKIFILLFLTVCVNVIAQDVVPYALTKQNATATYALLIGKKKKLNTLGISYYQLSVNSVTAGDDGSQTIMYRWDFLNKKKEISSLSGSVGSKGGFFNQVIFAQDGSYAMDQDYGYGFGDDLARGGYMFRIPGKLTVGQTLESSTVKQEYVMMKQKVTTNITYTNVKVDREEDYETPVGTFHCFVITYTMSVTINNANLGNTQGNLWVAPGIGVVSYQFVSGGTPICVELCELQGVN